MRESKGPGALIVTAALAVALFGGVVIGLWNGWYLRADFTALYTAGYLVAHGNGHRLYDPGEEQRVEEQLFRRRGWLPLTHPPFEALLFSPLSLLSYSQAYAIWGALNILIWLSWAWLVRPHAPIPQSDVEYLLLCASFLPAWIALFQGQTSFVLLLSYTLTFLTLKQGKRFRAGIFLGLSLLKFQFVLPLALVFLLRREWRVIGGLATVGLGLGLVSIVVVGPGGVGAYLDLLNRYARHARDPATAATGVLHTMASALAFFTFTMRPHFPPAWITATVAAFSAALILFVACWWKRPEAGLGPASLPPQAPLNRTFSVALLASLLAGPHFHIHDLTIALLPFLLTLEPSQGRSSWSPGNLVAAILFFPATYVLLMAIDRAYLLFPVLVAWLLVVVLQRNKPRLLSAEAEGMMP